ncbi:MAG: cell surface protein [Planctomycetaceae bacterium]|nr:cell surface protein [Planctomycetaceae bacterium]
MLAALLCLSLSVAHSADLKPASINVYPADVQLLTTRDRQSFIVQAVLPNGLTHDVTDQAKFTLANPALVRQEKTTLYPAADGETVLKVEYAGFTVDVPIKVEQATAERPISFELDVMPVFMKTGCNTGSCHGAASGKDGYRMSLFGYDAPTDHYRLTREIPGRRINLSLPKESLLMEKGAGQVAHSGGKRLEPGGEHYNTLIRWLEAGALPDASAVPKVTLLELYPKGAVLDGKGTTQRLSVRAQYEDGTSRDVTNLAYFSTSNDTAAGISQEGLVTAAARGEAFIMARFETHTVGSQFIVLPKGLQYEDPKTPEFNYIDTLVHNKLRKLRIAPSDVCSDETFLRRATIDIIGKLPTVDEYHRFVKDTDPKKREKLVDDLIGRKEFVEIWVMKWAELLQIRTVNNQISYKAMLRYYNWLQAEIAGNTPMNVMVQKLLGASGGTFASPATNYYQNERDTLKVTENVAQVFMGMRIQCAQCHNHPFDRWTMDDYYSFANFFAQIGRKRGEDPREQIIYNRASGDVRNPLGNRVMPPKFLGGAVPDVKGKDRRVVMAEWLASPENPFFATNLGNIVWAHFLGQGIVEPVDDVRVTNPAVNRELLDELGRRFTEYNYDFKRLVRDICVSRTYQLATQTNESNASDHRNFASAQLKRVRAEVLLDCISQVTNTQNKFRGLPTGARAVQIADGNTSTYFLTTFGRASRGTVCSCEVSMEPNLSQALHLLNGDTGNSKIAQGALVPTRLKEKKTPAQIIEELYISCFSRKPTEKESKDLTAIVASSDNPTEVLEDVLWSLLNAREFLFNH